jgi:hypothetical protein
MITHYRRPSPVLDDEIIVWFLNENHKAGLRGICAFLIYKGYKASSQSLVKAPCNNEDQTRRNEERSEKTFALFVSSWLISGKEKRNENRNSGRNGKHVSPGVD